MGTIMFAVCHDCKEYRDLDKYYTAFYEVTNREEALKFSESIEKRSFGSALALSFFVKHRGHSCTINSEHAAMWDSEVGDSYHEDKPDYWVETNE